ncbi:hypothetical protein IM977_002026 [Salmonella enterica subsp. enterica serovar Typhimurium]|nr:hypothetical protein [Salmonella enterica subsp. enterica serovar Typhimurium]
MKLNNPILIELFEMAVNARATVSLNDISAKFIFLVPDSRPVIIHFGYAFEEPVPPVWMDDISSQTRITLDEFKVLVSRYSYHRGFL